MRRESTAANWIAAVVVVLGIIAAGVFLARKASQGDTPSEAAAPAPVSAGSAALQVPIHHPIEQAGSAAAVSTAMLPTLDDSDAGVAAALSALAKGGDLSSLLVRQQIIARIVATIDALPRRGLASLVSPLHAPKGVFAVDDVEGATVIGARNATRYAPYMQVVDALDVQALVAWYVHSYPLFQRAYEQLGYPGGYFNDRLIVVIDNLLAAPEPAQSPAVTLSKGVYVYVDPTLESLSAGQKLLVRAGPVSEAAIKAKLRAIRATLTGQTLPTVPAGAGTAR